MAPAGAPSPGTGHRRRNLIVLIVFAGAVERLVKGVEDGHRQNHGSAVIFSWICAGREHRQTM